MKLKTDYEPYKFKSCFRNKKATFKVYYTVTIDGKQVHRVENKQPRTFSNVKILAGPDTNVADANYRNLMYETLPDFGTVKKV